MGLSMEAVAETGPGATPLGGDGETRLVRVARPGQPFSVLLRLADPDPRADPDRRAERCGWLLRRELDLAPRLDAAWAVMPLDWTEGRDGGTLTLADPGGQPLSTRPASSMTLHHRLLIAARAAEAVGHLHRRGLLHGDLRPFNLMVGDDRSVRLTGLGRAGPASGGALDTAGLLGDGPARLPYLAPERTGRMNRPADRRSDLYSLGVVLYELFCGALPFVARDPAEWIHGHLARPPIPPAVHAPDLPPPLSDILLRLLAKTAEERYQSADGQLSDLAELLRRLEAGGRVAAFPLGRRDRPDGLRPPAALYGRDRPAQNLRAAFDRVALRGRMGVALVSGPSGVGKSFLVDALRRQVVPPRGLFAAGKFDQNHRDRPYASLSEALRALIDGILVRPALQQDHWRRELREAVGGNGALLAALIPNLTPLIGESPPPPGLPPQEALHRFDRLIRGVLQVFARPDHPLALVLDDLQWLDRATLDLLDRLITGGGLPHLLLVGCYRSDEVGAGHPLAGLIHRVRDAGRDIDRTEIALGPLESHDLCRMVADSLDRAPEEVAPLADRLHARTGGNAFFAVQLLIALERAGGIRHDGAAMRWTWDEAAVVAAIDAAGAGEGVAALMGERLGRFAPAVRCLLVRMACLGASVRLATLALAAGVAPEAAERLLAPVVGEGLLLRTDDGYRFLHDRVQEGVLALVAEEARAALHLDIARALRGGGAAEAGDETLFELVGFYERCLPLLHDEAERADVAALCLGAGRRARAAGAHGSALGHVRTGLSLLDAFLADGDRWEHRYELSFGLEHLRAECEFLNGDLALAEQRLLVLVARARCLVDRAAITALLVTVYTAMDRSDRAIESCLSYLEAVGITWSAHPPAALAQREYDQLRAALGDRPIGSLVDLPAARDEDRRATLDVLAAALPPAFFSDRDLVCLILGRMANLSLEHGIGDASALGFAYLGMMAGPCFGDYPAGYAFGRLGLDLAERHGPNRYRARVLMTFAYHVSPWTRDVRSERPLLLRAFEEARESGDVTYGGFTSVTLITSMLAAGDPLATVQRTAEVRLAYVRQVRFGLCIDILTTQLQMIRALRGLTDAPDRFDEPGFDNAAFEARLRANRSLDIATCWHAIRTLQLRCVLGDVAGAVAAAEAAEGLLWTTSGHLEMAEHHIHAALARAAAMDGAAPEDRDRHAAALAQHRAQLGEWAKNAPDGFEARLALVEAEVARVEGRQDDAAHGYDRAARLARRAGRPHIEAMALERAAAFYAKRGLEVLRGACLREARDAYARWGAMGKVRQLDQAHPGLGGAVTEAVAAEPSGDLGGADLAALMETLRAVSNQASPEQVTDTLLTLVLEQAGASRGLLILARGERLRVEAEATIGPDGVSVRLVQEDAERVPLPLALIHGAIRDRETVIVDDARAAANSFEVNSFAANSIGGGPFAADPYLRDTDARSILCMPLVRRGRVTGLLHLENALTTHAFTQRRVALLTLLGAQAAAALETATLDEKEALLKEVHHRVKNNLQLVTSLLNLQSHRIADPEVAALFADSRDRVRAMALVHENLYRLGNFARVPMRAHLESVCAHLLRAYAAHSGPVRLEMALEDLKLDLDRAVPCGLIVNELVSNALKHAFPGGRGGILRVSLSGEGEFARLSVRDDGIGLPRDYDPDTVTTIGLQLVEDLTAQLHGTLRRGAGSGAEFVVLFPVSAGNGETE